MKQLFWFVEDIAWNIRCRYNFWLHGPYGLAKVVEKIPFRFIVKYLRKYGAIIGDNCHIERGLNLHRPIETPPFKNLVIGNNVYIGHKALIDLTCQVIIEDYVAIGSGCQLWTHVGYYEDITTEKPIYNEHRKLVIIRNGARIHSGALIKHGITIGERSEIGGGSVIVKNILPFSFSAGVPAITIKIKNQ